MALISRIASASRCKIIFILSLINMLFWIAAHSLNVYQYAVIGAVFEILWLPMVAGMFVLPVLSIIFWIKERSRVGSLCFSSLLINILSVILIQL